MLTHLLLKNLILNLILKLLQLVQLSKLVLLFKNDLRGEARGTGQGRKRRAVHALHGHEIVHSHKI